MPLFADPTIGLVQTPQHFYNPDPLQANLEAEHVLPDDQRFTQNVDLPSRDAWGVATSCGTSSVIRLASLEAIGGFPTESVCEDTLTSIKLWSLGQQSVFLNEPLTQGLAVEGVRQLLTQRSRWAIGNMQIITSQWGLLSRHRMPAAGRLFLLLLLLGAIISPVNRILIVLSPSVFLFTGTLPIPGDFENLFAYLGPFLLAHFIGTAWISRGASLPIINDAIQSVEYCSTFLASLSVLFLSGARRFEVTAKGISRDKIVVHWRLVAIFMIPILLYGTGLIYDLKFANAASSDPLTFVAVILWCIYNSLFLMLAAFISVDLPRSAHLDIFQLNQPALIKMESAASECVIEMMSSTAAAISFNNQTPEVLHADGPQAVALVMPDGYVLNGRLRPHQTTAGLFIVDIGASDKAAATRYLFRGKHFNSVQDVSPLRALERMFQRLVR